MLAGAASGITTFTAQLAQLGFSLLGLGVVICAFLIITKIGGQGFQREVRGLGLMLFLGALLLKSYQTLATGTLALFPA